jgi:hypothetical protein
MATFVNIREVDGVRRPMNKSRNEREKMEENLMPHISP